MPRAANAAWWRASLEAGVRTLPWTAMPAVTAPLAGILSDRIGGRRVIAVGMLLQIIAIGWLAAISTPTIAYGRLVPIFVFAGAGMGMGLFCAPIARLTIDFSPVSLQGVASGTSNALRPLGTVLGVAVLGAVFSATGSHASGTAFVDGLTATAWVGAAVLGVGTLLALAIADSPKVAPNALAEQAEVPEPIAV